MDTAAPHLRPMGLVDQLDAAFRLYRRHFLTFAGIAALLRLPLWALAVALGQVGVKDMGLVGTTYELRGPLALVESLADLIIQGILAVAVARAYLGRPTGGILGTFQYCLHRRRLLNVILSALAMSVIVVAVILPAGIGSMMIGGCGLLLIIPAAIAIIYVSLRLTLVPQVVVLEDQGVGAGIRRTWDLMKDHLGRVFRLNLLLWLVTQLIPQGLTGLAGLVSETLSISPLLGSWLTSGFSMLITLLLMPIPLAAYTLFYYDLRIRKEGYDLQLQAESLAPGGLPAG